MLSGCASYAPANPRLHLPKGNAARLQKCFDEKKPDVPVKLTGNQALAILAQDAALDERKSDCGQEALQQIGAVHATFGK